MRRGFKARCEQISEMYRAALSIPIEAALPYEELANYLGVLVYDIHDLPGLDVQHIHYLTEVDGSEWSAFTVTLGDKHLIVLNPTHSRRRQANDVMHELGHIILGHEGKAVIPVPGEGIHFFSGYEPEQEKEADWLAATLLLPRQGLVNVFRRTQDTGAIARRFGVSEQLVKMRINQTGIRYQFSRRKAK